MGTIVGGISAEAGATLRMGETSSFALNGSNVVLASALDFELRPTAGFSVTATDAAGNVSAALTVVRPVGDVNEAPVLTGPSVFTVPENATGVTTLSASDPEGQAITFGIAGGVDAGAFAINATTGALSFKTAPDFEASRGPRYEIQVSASDGVNALVKSLTIDVANVNEAPTAVTLVGTGASVMDDVNYAATGVKVADILVTDDALGLETLRLVGTDAAVFALRGTELFFVGQADYETRTNYQIVVSVDDPTIGPSGVPEATSAPFRVAVTDVAEREYLPGATVGTGANEKLYGDNAGNAIYGEGGADQVYGYGGNDRLFGGLGNDHLYGGGDNDTLDGGAGDDVLIGGNGADTFVFAAGFGQDTIVDFQAGPGQGDVVRFDGSLFASFAAVMAAASQVGANAVITHQAGTVTLNNVQVSGLHADDFSFVGTSPSVPDTTPPAAPVFTPAPGFTGPVPESTPAGTVIGSLSAEAGATLILSPAGPVSLQGTNVVLSAPLDFELAQSFSFSVTARDAAGNVSPAVQVTRPVGDVVEAINQAPTAVILTPTGAPVLDDVNYASAGIKVADIAVVDDALGTETLRVGGADAAQFVIRGTELFFVEAANFEARPAYQVTVGADDPTIGSLGSLEAVSTPLTIGVTDVVEPAYLPGARIGTAANEKLYGDNAANVIYGEGGGDQVYGYGGDDHLFGGPGDDHLYGGGDNDVLHGGVGNDVLVGGKGNDTFVFAAGFGTDIITDFQAGAGPGDVLRFGGIFANEASLRAATQQVGMDVVITVGANSLTLQGVSLASLHSDDLLFV